MTKKQKILLLLGGCVLFLAGCVLGWLYFPGREPEPAGEGAPVITKPYFGSSDALNTADETALTFSPSTPRLDYSYKGQLNNEKRYLAIGFDDFRDSDFSLIIPLLEKYDARATFNRITGWHLRSGGSGYWLTDAEKNQISSVVYGGHELGDHTIMHLNFLFTDPLCNGQDPEDPDGDQVPYPTNDQIRTDRGDGKNIFGMDLNDTTASLLCFTAFDVAFRDLTDAQCQVVREFFSIMKVPQWAEVFDTYSNIYLGTTGSSAGSWDEKAGCYTGGIFTGCRTSQNHEIWERVLQIIQRLYKDQYGLNFDFKTWSYPGDIHSPFQFEKNGEKFYDEACTVHANYLAKMPGSLTQESRSWTDVLRNAGYTVSHDYLYPSRIDGQELPMMSRQLIYNASLSRKDAVLYPTNSSILYTMPGEGYDEDFFTDGKSKAAQMYDDGGEFYTFIESIRQNTSNGMVHGEVIDSVDCYSERIFMEELLRYCRQTGVEVITKAEAYDLCFNHKLYQGNLIYNPGLRNTAREFMPDAENIPTNPDGYTGKCYVTYDEDHVPVLNVEAGGSAEYLHYGVPTGTLTFRLDAAGTGSIRIYTIKNSDSVALNSEELVKAADIQLSGSDSFESYNVDFLVRDYPLTEYEDRCEGYGDKIMGIKIVYDPGIRAKNMQLELA